MRIALDAMGGDYAPSEIIKGAVIAGKKYNLEIVLVGDEKEIISIARDCDNDFESYLKVEHAPEVIGMDENPAKAVRNKTNSSIVRSVNLVSEGQADAIVSMGNTGAVMAASLLISGRIKGVSRPALAIPMPTVKGFSLILDCGATTDCKPENLRQFAVMGSIYMEKVFQRPNPSVALLNIGQEKSKGNELTKGAYSLLESSSLNFIGNIEGRSITSGVADVIVCDGFTGNIILKFAEGMGSSMISMIKEEVSASLKSKIAGLFLRNSFKRVKKRMDYTEYGGVPLLGVNDLAVIGHGSSKAKAVSNALRVAHDGVVQNIVSAIGDNIAESGVAVE